MLKNFFKSKATPKNSDEDINKETHLLRTYKESLVPCEPLFKVYATMNLSDYSFNVHIDGYDTKKGVNGDKIVYEIVKPSPNNQKGAEASLFGKVKHESLNALHFNQTKETFHVFGYVFEKDLNWLKKSVFGEVEKKMLAQKKSLDTKLNELINYKLDF